MWHVAVVIFVGNARDTQPSISSLGICLSLCMLMFIYACACHWATFAAHVGSRLAATLSTVRARVSSALISRTCANRMSKRSRACASTQYRWKYTRHKQLHAIRILNYIYSSYVSYLYTIYICMHTHTPKDTKCILVK